MNRDKYDMYERATEQFIEQFIDNHGREPTEEEILAAEEDAYQNYISGMEDAIYERMKDEQYE